MPRTARRAFALCVALALLASAAPARAEAPDQSRSPYQLQLYIDVPILVGTITLWIVPSYAVGGNVPGSPCGTTLPNIATTGMPPDSNLPCDPSKLNPLDRLVVGHYNPTARPISDAFFALPALFAAVEVFDVGITHWRSYLTDALVSAEAVTINGAMDEIVRRAVRRPRPYLYIDGAYPDDRNKPEASFSFYSGHTSSMYALAVSLAYTYNLRHRQHWPRYLVWTGLLAIASVEPLLRVLSGDHFPTDVAVGALIGSSLGAIVPALHRRPDFIPGITTVTLVPTNMEGGAMLSLVGRF